MKQLVYIFILCFSLHGFARQNMDVDSLRRVHEKSRLSSEISSLEQFDDEDEKVAEQLVMDSLAFSAVERAALLIDLDSNALLDSVEIEDSLERMNEYDEFADMPSYRERLFSEKDTMNAIFGMSFFRSPRAEIQIGPVNPDYRLGVGDEIVISMWGDVQLTEPCVVNRLGTISPKGVGQIRVAGLSLRELDTLLLKRFSRIYSGVRNGRSNATTFVDVSLGKLRQKSVFIVGEVAEPGNYMIPSTAGLLVALSKAGGPTDIGSFRNIIIRRSGTDVVDTIDLYRHLLSGVIVDTLPVADFDVIIVPPVDKRVTVDGAVYRPAQYELKSDETFADLIEYAGGFLPEAFQSYINVERTIPGVDRQLFTFADTFFVASLPEKNDYITVDFVDKIDNTVHIIGAVRRPGVFAVDSVLTFSKIVEQAGGFADDYFGERAEILRTYDDFRKEVIAVNIDELLKNPDLDVSLQKWDVIQIFTIWDLLTQEFVEVRGEVKRPGKYYLRKGMAVQDLILLAGGFTDSAYKDTVELSRVVSNDSDDEERTEAYRFEVDSSFFQRSTMTLQHQDNLFVRSNSYYDGQSIVYLSGEFQYPGHYAKRTANETLSSLFARCGGLKENAFLGGARFKRSKDSVGVIALDLVALFEKNKHREDIILEDGDILFVPTTSRTVKVFGAVNSPTSVKFQPRKTVRHYLNRAGGFSSIADKRSMFIIQANGEVRKVRRGSRGILPGAELIVAEEEQVDEKSNILAFTQSIIGIAASLVTIMLLVNELTAE